jgi:hypothetical protein
MPRDSAGNYSLVAGNPVQSGEVVSSSWANNTLDDVAVALSDSLDRNGRGGMLAPFRFSDGTNLLPGAAWVNETTTGFYRFDGGDLRVSILTQDVMRWQTSGVQIWDNTDLQWNTVLTDGGGGSQVPVNVGTADYQTLVWDNTTDQAWKPNNLLNVDFDNGTVGIGTTAPDTLLTVQKASSGRAWSTGSNDAAVFENSGGTSVTIVAGTTSPSRLYFGDSDLATVGRIVYDHTDNGMQFWTNSTRQMDITSAGRVGIGTASTLSKLTVAGVRVDQGVEPVLTLRNTTNTSGWGSQRYGGIEFYSDDVSGSGAGVRSAINCVPTGDAAGDTGATGDLTFLTGSNVSTERMRITSAGNVGIGTTAPSGIFHVKSTNLSSIFENTANSPSDIQMWNGRGAGVIGARFQSIWEGNEVANIELHNGSASSIGQIAFRTANGGAATERMRITDTGDVGIGTDAPDTLLAVSGAGGFGNGFALTGYGGNPTVTARRANGTEALPTAVTNGQELANYNGRGYKATGWGTASGSIRVIAAEDFTDTATGGILSFRTTNLGATSHVERMTIDASGNVAIGNPAGNVENAKLYVEALNGAAIFYRTAVTPANAITAYYSDFNGVYTRQSQINIDGSYNDLVAAVNYTEEILAAKAKVTALESQVSSLLAAAVLAGWAV